jgi:FAD/FMN-containing dehydrogenase
MDPALILPARGGLGLITLDICYSGPPQNAEAALAPIRKLGKPDKDTLKAEAYVDVQRSGDTGDSRAIASYLKGGFISKVPGDLVSSIADGIPADANRTTVLFFQHCGGAASRQPENATAFAQRDSVANMMAVAAWRTGTVDPAEHIQATRKYWSTLEPFTRGFYVNDLAREATSSEINSNYRGNYPRLVKIKQTYDPTNLFRLNANIQPPKA